MTGWAEFSGIVLKVFGVPSRWLWALMSSAVVAYWLGAPTGLQTVAKAAVVVWLLDTVMGTALALKDKQYSSRAFGRSISKLVVYGLAVAVSIPIGAVFGSIPGVGLGGGLHYAVTYAVFMLIFIREATSTVENLACMGFPMPRWVTERLHRLHESMCEQDPYANEENTDGTDGGS